MSVFRQILKPLEGIALFAVLVRQLGVATTTIGGTIGFRVHGEGGGDWVVDLSQPGGVWTQPSDDGAVGACHVALFAEADAFSSFVLDPGHVITAIASGTVVVDGDRRRLARLGSMLSQRGNVLNQRARVTREERRHSAAGV